MTKLSEHEILALIDKHSDDIRSMWLGSKRQSMEAQHRMFGPPFGWPETKYAWRRVSSRGWAKQRGPNVKYQLVTILTLSNGRFSWNKSFWLGSPSHSLNLPWNYW